MEQVVNKQAAVDGMFNGGYVKESAVKRFSGKIVKDGESMMAEYANFEVREADMCTVCGLEVPGKKAIISNQGKVSRVIGIVSDRYSIVTNKAVQTVFDRAIRESFKGEIHTRTSLPYYGGKMIKEYLLVDDSYVTDIKPGDAIMPTVSVFNSYDNSTPVGFTLGAYRLVCANGLVTKSTLVSVSVKHFEAAAPEKLGKRFEEEYGFLLSSMALWRKWANKEWTKEQAETYLTDCVRRLIIGEKAKQDIMSKFATETQTKWMFFNAMTWYATHQLRQKTETQKMNLAYRQLSVGHALTGGLYTIDAA